MKAILSVVGIVALVSSTSAEIDVPEYSREKYEELPLFDPKAKIINAAIINPDIERIHIAATYEEQKSTATLFVASPRDQEEGRHPICKGSLGIDLDDGGSKIFCKLDLINIKIGVTTNPSGETFMVLGLGFGFIRENHTPMSLEIPIFKVPSEYASPNQKEQFEKWASDNRLGIVSPMDLAQLKHLLDFKRLINNYFWLEKLVSLGISKRPVPVTLELDSKISEIESYVTQPLVLSDDIITKLIELVEDSQDESTATSSKLLTGGR